jgi:hypothetical protein
MPVSRNRKKHKQKAKARRNRVSYEEQMIEKLKRQIYDEAKQRYEESHNNTIKLNTDGLSSK